jgi:hypothetical protein
VDNALVPRFSRDQNVESHLRASYATDGGLTVPVVTMHTCSIRLSCMGKALYAAKVQQAGASGSSLQIPGAALASAFGHCEFTLGEVQNAFALLVSQVTAP